MSGSSNMQGMMPSNMQAMVPFSSNTPGMISGSSNMQGMMPGSSNMQAMMPFSSNMQGMMPWMQQPSSMMQPYGSSPHAAQFQKAEAETANNDTRNASLEDQVILMEAMADHQASMDKKTEQEQKNAKKKVAKDYLKSREKTQNLQAKMFEAA